MRLPTFGVRCSGTVTNADGTIARFKAYTKEFTPPGKRQSPLTVLDSAVIASIAASVITVLGIAYGGYKKLCGRKPVNAEAKNKALMETINKMTAEDSRIYLSNNKASQKKAVEKLNQAVADVAEKGSKEVLNGVMKEKNIALEQLYADPGILKGVKEQAARVAHEKAKSEINDKSELYMNEATKAALETSPFNQMDAIKEKMDHIVLDIKNEEIDYQGKQLEIDGGSENYRWTWLMQPLVSRPRSTLSYDSAKEKKRLSLMSEVSLGRLNKTY
ncbi:hypothetical protein OQA88_9226 [Cercophora sp. LCS_1]